MPERKRPGGGGAQTLSERAREAPVCFHAPPAAACALLAVGAERLGPRGRPCVPCVPSRSVLCGLERSEVQYVLRPKYSECNGRVTSRFVTSTCSFVLCHLYASNTQRRTQKTAPSSPNISRCSPAQVYFESTIGTSVLLGEPLTLRRGMPDCSRVRPRSGRHLGAHVEGPRCSKCAQAYGLVTRPRPATVDPRRDSGPTNSECAHA